MYFSILLSYSMLFQSKDNCCAARTSAEPPLATLFLPQLDVQIRKPPNMLLILPSAALHLWPPAWDSRTIKNGQPELET